MSHKLHCSKSTSGPGVWSQELPKDVRSIASTECGHTMGGTERGHRMGAWAQSPQLGAKKKKLYCERSEAEGLSSTFIRQTNKKLLI